MDLVFRSCPCWVGFSANCRSITENNQKGVDRLESHTALSTTTTRVPISRPFIFVEMVGSRIG